MKKITTIIIVFFNITCLLSQVKFATGDPFQIDYFIENKGQFNRFNKGKMLYDFGLENTPGQTIYFGQTGFDFYASYNYKNEESSISHNQKVTSNSQSQNQVERIGFRWIGANEHYIKEGFNKSGHYFSYGDKGLQAYGYKKILYKNLYPNIDVLYEIGHDAGVKYSLIMHPGANLSDIRWKYEGENVDVKVYPDSIKINVGSYEYIEKELFVYDAEGKQISLHYQQNQSGTISFESKTNWDNTKNYQIDPWVGTCNTLTGINNGVFGNGKNKGILVDFDKFSNLIVYGGGTAAPFGNANSSFNQKVSRYNTNGVLLWTFMGSIPSIGFESASNRGSLSGMITEKNTCNIYTANAEVVYVYGTFEGPICVRLDSNGIYDNFKTKKDTTFSSIYSIDIHCKDRRLILMGRNGYDNRNGIVNIFTLIKDSIQTNIKYLSSYPPSNNWGVFHLSNTRNVKNELFTLIVPRSISYYHWGYVKLSKDYSIYSWIDTFKYLPNNSIAIRGGNRAFYCQGDPINLQALAASLSYLYVYDGKLIHAINANNGVLVKTDSISSHVNLMQSGSYADECNNIYLGGKSGNIKVLHFDGTNFIPKPDILIPGFANRGIYDIKFNPMDGLLYVSGDSLVATVKPNQTCGYADTIVQCNLSLGCQNNAVATILNKDTFTYSFNWFDSTANSYVRKNDSSEIATDSCPGLIKGHWYRLEIIKCPLCGMGKKTITFKYDSCITYVNASICPGKSFLFNAHTYNKAGMYYDTLKSSLGGDSIVATNLSLKPISSTNLNIGICEGKSYSVNNHTYTTTGIYKDTMVNAVGCDSIITLNLTVHPLPNPTIIKTGNIMSTQGFTTYQWKKNGLNINGATNQEYNATTNGNYSVEVTDTNNCKNTSQVYNFILSKIQNIKGIDFNIYPNPTNGMVSVQTINTERWKASVYDVNGSNILETSFIQNTQLDFRKYANGVYLIKLVNEKGESAEYQIVKE